MKAQSSNLYKLYQLAFEDRLRFYRSLILSGIIFVFSFLAIIHSFILIKNGFSLKEFLLMFFSWLFALSCFCFLGVGASLRNLFLGVSFLSLAFFLSFIYLGYPLLNWLYLILFYLFSIFCLLLAIFWFRQEANLLVNLSFYRIFKRGSWFLALLILGVFYFLISWHYSLNFDNLGDFLIDKLPLPFNYSVDDFLLKTIKGNFNFLGINQGLGNFQKKNKLLEDLKKLNGEVNLPEFSEREYLEKLDETEQNEIIFRELRTNLENFFNKPIKGDENMNQLVKEYLKETLRNNLNLPIFQLFYIFFLIILAFSLIGLINSILGIFITLLIHIFLLPLFIRLKLIKIERKGIEKELIVI